MSLPLTPVVDVEFNLPAPSAPRFGFDLGLIIGSSAVISTSTRVVEYDSLEEMASAGFSTSSPEYLAAQAYFSANPTPNKVAIGRQGSGETELQAITACRTANENWFGAYIPSADNSDHTAIAAYVQALTGPATYYFLQTSDAAVLNNTTGNLFATLKTAGYSKSWGLYSTQAHEVARAMGFVASNTTDAVGSAWIIALKNLPGGTPMNITSAQVNNIKNNYGNVYIQRGGFYNGIEDGRVFGGQFLDSMIYRDKLANEAQLAVADLLYGSSKIPQTEAGMAQLRTVVSKACGKLASIGYIAPGPWRGSNFTTFNLKQGDVLPLGYAIFSESIASQNASDRNNRIGPPIYIALNEAGGIQSIMIRVNLNP